MSTCPVGDELSPVHYTPQVTPNLNPQFSDQVISTLIFLLIPLQTPHIPPLDTRQSIQNRNVI